MMKRWLKIMLVVSGAVLISACAEETYYTQDAPPVHHSHHDYQNSVRSNAPPVVSSGEISSGPGGFFLSGLIPYGQGKADVQWALKASLKEAMLADKYLSLTRINTPFSYESAGNRLQFIIKDAELQAFSK